MNKKILLVDTDEEVIKQLEALLLMKNYELIVARDGEKAIDISTKQKIDLIILEVSLPELDGFSLCKLLRAEGYKTPIIFLTSKTSEISAVIGLELGAQDYIRKPVQAKELLARIDLQLELHDEYRKLDETSVIQGLEIDIEKHSVKHKGMERSLSLKEFQLLKTLAKNPGKVFSREELLQNVWGFSQCGKTRTVDIHIGSLRKKLEDNPRSPKLFKTVRGVGYYLDSG